MKNHEKSFKKSIFTIKTEKYNKHKNQSLFSHVVEVVLDRSALKTVLILHNYMENMFFSSKNIFFNYCALVVQCNNTQY